jgi:hypothetical protein
MTEISTARVQVDRDLTVDLQEQLGFLKASAKAYDEGHEAEAKRLAATLRLLLHDTRNQRSLLSCLGVRDKIPWSDTSHGEPPPGVMRFDAGLAVMRMVTGPDAEVTYQPVLGEGGEDRAQPAQAFADWWDETIMSDSAGNSFSRADLVLAVCNQDGGAHIDERLNQAYAALTRRNSLGFIFASGGIESGSASIGFGPGAQTGPGEPLKNSPALANVRQIAWEVEDSIKRHLVAEPAVVYVCAPICPMPFKDAVGAGRNDPCPCGSGRKYKHCFGRRQPRWFRSPPSGMGA